MIARLLLAALLLASPLAAPAWAAVPADEDEILEQETTFLTLCHPARSGRSEDPEDSAAQNEEFLNFLDNPQPIVDRLMKKGVLVKAVRDADEGLREDWDATCGYLSTYSKDIGVRGCFDSSGVKHYAVRATQACAPLWARIEMQGGM